MAKYSASKVSTDAPNGFDTTEKWALLMCSNVSGNNNKYFLIELQHNSTTNEYRLFSHYGRLAGDTADGGVYDVRGPDTNRSDLEAEYDRIIREKEKGKSKTRDDGTKYRENYVKVDVVQPTVGSPNIRKTIGAAATATVSKQNSGITSMFSQFGKQEQSVLNQLFAENVHNITSATAFKMTAHGLETPLGPLTLDHITKATAALDELKKYVPDDGTAADLRDNTIRDINTQVFSLIPRPFARGYRIQDSDLICTAQRLVEEYDLLDQMRSTVQITRDADDTKHDLGLTMELSDKGTTDELFHYFNSTRNHGSLSGWHPVRCYDVTSRHERERFTQRAARLEQESINATKVTHRSMKNSRDIVTDYDVVDLFHGTRNSNVLSMLLNGFVVPPVNAPHVTGRMYSAGCYGANISTKALNYSLGNWSRSGLSYGSNHKKNAFMFITKFAMGKIFYAPRALPGGAPREFNSIYAPGGADLQNDEFIVRDPSQATLTHLIEIEYKG